MNGCIALLLLAGGTASLLWLWNADVPSEYRTIGSISVAVVTLLGILLLARPKQPSQPPGAPPPSKPASAAPKHSFTALLVLALGIGTVAWIWLEAEVLFPTRTAQWRSITIWAVILITLAGIYRASKTPPKPEKLNAELLQQLLKDKQGKGTS